MLQTASPCVKEVAVATNGYRVLLTRARKGMIVFIPRGDPTGEDETRPPSMYDDIANYIISCGGREWPASASQ